MMTDQRHLVRASFWQELEPGYQAAVSMTAGVSSLAVKDCGNGSYTASARSVRAGILTLAATINGEMVGLPVTVAVEPGPLATLEACSSAPLHCKAGETLGLTSGSKTQPRASVLHTGTYLWHFK